MVYSKQQLSGYLTEVKGRLHAKIESVDLESATPYPHTGANWMSTMVYNLRHLAHHVGQLSLLVRRNGGGQIGWSGRGETPKKEG